MNKVVLKGNIAVVEGAVRAGCRLFFGYPITPQNEIPNYVSARFPALGGTYLQAESEIAAINMVYGAACTGARAMTTSSSPGISLMQEAISYLVGCELPCVIVNVVRGGPGLGNIAAAQSDYFQATKGGGHGDYNLIVLAPWSVQEMHDFTYDAFDLADKYRRPAIVLADGILGQMMEPLNLESRPEPSPPEKPWATRGTGGGNPKLITSLYTLPKDLSRLNRTIYERWLQACREDVRWEVHGPKDAEVMLVAYGTAARVCKGAVDLAEEEGIALKLFRPATVSPFPYEALAQEAGGCAAVIAVEMSLGQMVYDVRLAVNGKVPVHFYGEPGGVLIYPHEVVQEAQRRREEAYAGSLR